MDTLLAIVPFIYYLLLLCLGVVTALVLWRFLLLRSSGSVLVLRELPANGNHGWRHGVARYYGNQLRFFQLRSLRPWSDRIFTRQEITITGTRPYTPAEESFLDPNMQVVEITQAGVSFEIAMSNLDRTGFLSWVESAPSKRLDPASTIEARRRLVRAVKKRKHYSL